MGDAHHCSGSPVSKMTYTVSSGTLNSTIPYRNLIAVDLWIVLLLLWFQLTVIVTEISVN